VALVGAGGWSAGQAWSLVAMVAFFVTIGSCLTVTYPRQRLMTDPSDSKAVKIV
jgi:hypothetical protein